MLDWKLRSEENFPDPDICNAPYFPTVQATLSHSPTRPPCVSNDPGCLLPRSEGGTRARRPSCKLLHTKKTRRSTNKREGTRTYNSDDSEKKRGRAFWFTSAIWPRFSARLYITLRAATLCFSSPPPERSMRRSSGTVRFYQRNGNITVPNRARRRFAFPSC